MRTGELNLGTGSEELEVNGVEDLKRQLKVAERKTDYKFNGNDMIG